jgi:branched-chain amino acid transport system ATP-binding protein
LFEARNLHVHFEGVIALQDLSLNVDESEIVGLIGPNGSGKTTFFNVVSGFVKPNKGKVLLFNNDITQLSPSSISTLKIARTFQNLEMFPFMTVLENVMVGNHNRVNGKSVLKNLFSRVERQRQEFMALEMLDFLGISGFEKSRPAGMPYGIQKLVELARALAVQPRLLLLDEPAAGMNEQETIEMSRIIRDIRNNLGITVLVVEHDMSLVMPICDRVIVLNSGEKLAEGKPEEIKTNPDVLEVFLGKSYAEGNHA